jgi:hypothetical protein
MASEIARSVEAWNAQQVSELEQLLFCQRKRLVDAERTLHGSRHECMPTSLGDRSSSELNESSDRELSIDIVY